ncbi:VOC family protein [Novosphingobium bradum]|uniref:VOC family protein n=1 Tax=Novosphingobium bradum TaxID=1737444 RepID=A0ABV7IS48_9SPHN
MSSPLKTRLGSTRLIVRDLDRQARFYREAFGFGESLRMTGQIVGRDIEEIIFLAPKGQAGLILLAYADGHAPSPLGATLLFFTSDIAQLQDRVLAAGGSVVQAIGPIDLGTRQSRLAFFADPEGFLIEVIEDA